jgi:hypothetical protein
LGPLQQQIVRNSVLQDVENSTALQFCGGQIVRNEPSTVKEQILSSCQSIADVLARDRYKGMFGVDFIIANNKVYVIEINARTTGMLPLIIEQSAEYILPMYLLHILELLGEDYGIDELSESINAEKQSPDGMYTVFNIQKQSVYLQDVVATGNYKWENNNLVKLSGSPRWSGGKTDFVIRLYCSKGRPADNGAKMCEILSKEHIADFYTGELTKKAKKVVEKIRSFELPVE